MKCVDDIGLAIRVRGRVQGVGFRPNVFRLAKVCGVTGDVRDDAHGVVVYARGRRQAVELFLTLVQTDAPSLGRITSVESAPATMAIRSDGLHIVERVASSARTRIAPDAALCSECRNEVIDPFQRRFRYPFANCTRCGPRLSIVRRIPYDRANTTMTPFVLCEDCGAEYADPADRRFGAPPIACHRCGPRATLARMDGRSVTFELHAMLDDVDAARSLLQKGAIVAIKGIGGFHLACDATDAGAVARLRARKIREEKPFAVMAYDVEMIRRYCTVSVAEEALLHDPAAPIVLLRADGEERLRWPVAPGSRELGFMLPATPLQLLIMRRMGHPIVMTSGNRSGEPQVTGNAEARERLGSIAEYVLDNDREIVTRLDDSVVRVVAGEARVLRRARGYAPEPIALPPGFASAPDVIALGAELKSTFCLLVEGEAVLSHHLGDLEDVLTYADFEHNLARYEYLFDRRPVALAVDRHPGYLSSNYGRERARREGLVLVDVQHHHAHVASVLAERGRPRDAPPVLGIVLDGLGFGDGGELWGGEFLIADYGGFRRAGTFKPVALPGGGQAMREPWRNTYAHLMAELGWAEFTTNFASLDLFTYLREKPLGTLDGMIAGGINSPRASSCGRLFDAVAGAIGLARERVAFEGQAAMLLEAAVDYAVFDALTEERMYPFAFPRLDGRGLPYIEPLGMWRALLGDLIRATPIGTIAARFHYALAHAVATFAIALTRGEYADEAAIDTIALSGDCFQNAILLEAVTARLERAGFTVLSNARVPANDGGLALGQAAIAAATLLAAAHRPR
jgi:hydrogenase maturation protein HypF